MFYCDRCAKKRAWPETMFKSSGRCETCGKHAVCNEMPTSSLPPRTVGDKIEAIRGLSIAYGEALARNMSEFSRQVNASVQRPRLVELTEGQLADLIREAKVEALREFAFFAREHRFPGDDAGNQFADVWAKRAEGRACELEATP